MNLTRRSLLKGLATAVAAAAVGVDPSFNPTPVVKKTEELSLVDLMTRALARIPATGHRCTFYATPDFINALRRECSDLVPRMKDDLGYKVYEILGTPLNESPVPDIGPKARCLLTVLRYEDSTVAMSKLKFTQTLVHCED